MKLLTDLESLVSDRLNLFKTLFSLILLEARLARLSIFPLIINLVLLIIITLSTWLLLITFICYVLSFIFPMVYAIALVLLLQAAALYGLLNYLKLNLRNVSFEKTRKYFSKDTEHVKLQKTINEGSAEPQSDFNGSTN